MWLAGIFASAYLGFALLALSQSQHWQRVAGASPPGRTRVILFRGGGAVLLAGSLALALLRDGPGFGSLLWATAISIAALGVALTLAWRPGVLRPLVAVARCF